MGDPAGLGEEADAKEESEKEESPGMTRSERESSWEDSRTGYIRWEGIGGGVGKMTVDGRGRCCCLRRADTSVVRSVKRSRA